MSRSRLDPHALLAGLLLLSLVRPAQAQSFEQFFQKSDASRSAAPPPAPGAQPSPAAPAAATASPPTASAPTAVAPLAPSAPSPVRAAAKPASDKVEPPAAARGGLHFVAPATDADGRWQVVGPGNVEVCVIPCERPLADTTGWRLLRTSRTTGQITDSISLLDLRLRADVGTLRVQPRLQEGSTGWLGLSIPLGIIGVALVVAGTELAADPQAKTPETGAELQKAGVLSLGLSAVFLLPLAAYRAAGFDTTTEPATKAAAPLRLGVAVGKGTIGLGGSF